MKGKVRWALLFPYSGQRGAVCSHCGGSLKAGHTVLGTQRLAQRLLGYANWSSRFQAVCRACGDCWDPETSTFRSVEATLVALIETPPPLRLGVDIPHPNDTPDKEDT